MNKLAFILVCILILFSCSPSVELSNSLTKHIVNNTNKLIINEVITEREGNYSVRVAPYGSGDITISIKTKSKSKFLAFAVNYHIPWLKVKKDCIYNLNDTTSCIFLKKYTEKGKTYHSSVYNYEDLSGIELTHTDSIYVSCLSKGESIGINNNNPHLFVTLTVNEKLLSIMEKDYTMLEKFKDYYR